MTANELRAIRAAILDWYDANHRPLPWRAAPGTRPDPYRVWVSEVMLQQTRVATAIPYYLRWIERFPDLRTLAEAEQEDVLKEWEGLGYYSRARNFHRAVREVAASYGGEVPGNPEAFRTLPGVGRYTAGAVMSIAFGMEEPVVDGNVRRVFARLLDESAPPDSALWSLAASMAKGERPGDLNQGLMELGARICTPRSPSCSACPVEEWCRARAAGTVSLRPARRRAGPIPTERHGVALVRRGREILVARRPDRGRLGGLWEFPGAARAEGESMPDAAARAVREMGSAIPLRIGPHVATVTHTFSHVKVIYEAYAATVSEEIDAPKPAPPLAWARLDRLGDFPMPRAQRRIAALALDGPEGPVEPMPATM